MRYLANERVELLVKKCCIVSPLFLFITTGCFPLIIISCIFLFLIMLDFVRLHSQISVYLKRFL